jgi:ATP citrate (pro-S)-lyase
VWPSPWGRDLTKEEAYIQKLDGSTGASLKLTVLNPEGRVWTMVAGGGASVVYRCAFRVLFFPGRAPPCLLCGWRGVGCSDRFWIGVPVCVACADACLDFESGSDAIAAHGFAHELANYGEYSGAPTEGQTYEYAKTIGVFIWRRLRIHEISSPGGTSL